MAPRAKVPQWTALQSMAPRAKARPVLPLQLRSSTPRTNQQPTQRDDENAMP